MTRTINGLQNELHLSLAKLAAQLADLRRHVTRLDGQRAIRLWREEWQLHEYMLILRRRIYHFAIDRRGDEVDSNCGQSYRVEIRWDAEGVEESRRLSELRKTNEAARPKADGRKGQAAGDSGYCSVCGTTHSAGFEGTQEERSAAPALRTTVASSSTAEAADFTWIHCWLSSISDDRIDCLDTFRASGEIWSPPPNRPFPPACDSEGWTEWNEDRLADLEDAEIDSIVASSLAQSFIVKPSVEPGLAIGDIWDSLLLPSVPSAKEPEALSGCSEAPEELFSSVFMHCGALTGCPEPGTQAAAPAVNLKNGLKRKRSIPGLIRAAVRVFT